MRHWVFPGQITFLHF
uniref:Uncharacterized protein n=1 Tax=Anguilla anguilla TaxID=7936 RepID=A0A0E9UYF1_ANGAN